MNAPPNDELVAKRAARAMLRDLTEQGVLFDDKQGDVSVYVMGWVDFLALARAALCLDRGAG